MLASISEMYNLKMKMQIQLSKLQSETNAPQDLKSTLMKEALSVEPVRFKLERLISNLV